MPFTDAEKVEIRRHLGYGPVGLLPSGGSFISYRFFVTQGLLEFRINNLSPAEEAVVRGTGSQTSPINPNFTDSDTNTIYDGYLPICGVLEGKVAQSSGDLDTDKAGDWTARKEEIAQRILLYNVWCKRLAQFLYIPLGAGHPMARTAGTPGAMIN